MFRTKFEQLFENPDTLVALWLVFFWRGQHRADDEGLHLAARAMIKRGDLTDARWEKIREEAKELDRCIDQNARVPNWVHMDCADLAITAGEPLPPLQLSNFPERVSNARRRAAPPGSYFDDERRYLEGLAARYAAQASALVS